MLTNLPGELLDDLRTAWGQALEFLRALDDYLCEVRQFARFGNWVSDYDAAIAASRGHDFETYSRAMGEAAAKFRRMWYEAGASRYSEQLLVYRKHAEFCFRRFAMSLRKFPPDLMLSATAQYKQVDQTRRAGIVAPTWCEAVRKAHRIAMPHWGASPPVDQLFAEVPAGDECGDSFDWRMLLTFFRRAMKAAENLPDEMIDELRVGIEQEFALAERFCAAASTEPAGDRRSQDRRFASPTGNEGTNSDETESTGVKRPSDLIGQTGQKHSPRADSKADTPKKKVPKLPDSPDVRDLCRRLQTEIPKGRSKIDIAREFTGEIPPDDKKAHSLLRQARRYKHLYKGDG